MAWAKNGTPLTLGSALDDMDITDLTAKKFNMFMIHQIHSANISTDQTFNNNTNSVYAIRGQTNGGSTWTAVSQTKFDFGVDNYDQFMIFYWLSISGEEKLGMGWLMNTMANASAGTAPQRVEYAMKFVPSPDADITRIDFHNISTGDLAIGSNISALGTD